MAWSELDMLLHSRDLLLQMFIKTVAQAVAPACDLAG